jgi:hypothetical protein
VPRPVIVRCETKGNCGREHQREPDFELWEDACHEGERDADKSLLTDVPKTDSAK